MDIHSRQRLANLVAARRKAIRLSVTRAAPLAGVSRNTWTNLERNRHATAGHNFAGIEAALQWRPGSVEAILEGGDPVPVPAQPQTPRGIEPYRDHETGEVYDDPYEQQLWNLDLPPGHRRRLIYVLRAERLCIQAEQGTDRY